MKKYVFFVLLAFFTNGCVGLAVNGTAYLIDSGELDIGLDARGSTKSAVSSICSMMAKNESLAEDKYEGLKLKVSGRLQKPKNIYDEYFGSYYVLYAHGASIHFIPRNDEAKTLVNKQLITIIGTIRSLGFSSGICSIILKKTTVLRSYPLGYKPAKIKEAVKINENKEGKKKVIIKLNY